MGVKVGVRVGIAVCVQVGVTVALGGKGVNVGVGVVRGVDGSLGVGERAVVGVVEERGTLAALVPCTAMIDVAEVALDDAAPGVRQPLSSSPSTSSAVRRSLTLLSISLSPGWRGLV
jgi:hypothetical protein